MADSRVRFGSAAPGLQLARRRVLPFRAGQRAAKRRRDFERKRVHIAKILYAVFGILPAEIIDEWVRAFRDEVDPTFVVGEWLAAGWRDPTLVQLALGLFQERGMAEAVLRDLAVPLDSQWSLALDAELRRLQSELKDT